MTAPSGELWPLVEETVAPAGTLAFWWLYQAGLIVKSPAGHVIAVDPYLSDAANRSYGQRRNVPAPLDPAEARLDAVLASHSHEDHLDPDAVPEFARYPATRFVGPPLVASKLSALGVTAERVTVLRRGDHLAIGDLEITAVAARHPFEPEPVPDAIGYLVSLHDAASLYHSGDTEYDADIVRDVRAPSAAFIAINGTAGNMNADEAAMLAWRTGAKVAVPFHYGLWSDAGYGEGATIDPLHFVATYEKLSPGGRSLVLRVGATYLLDAEGVSGPIR